MCSIVALNILFQDEMWFKRGGEIGLVGIFGLVTWVEFVSGRSKGSVVGFGVSLMSWE